MEYLDDYITAGGSVVKFVSVDNDETRRLFSTGLATAAISRNYLHTKLTSEQTQLQFTEEFFFGVARQVDWIRLASNFVRRTYADLGVLPHSAAGSNGELSVAQVAPANGLNISELYRSMRRALEKTILGDSSLLYHFRVAMLRICQSLLDQGDASAADRDIVLGWLHGNTVPLPRLRSLGLFVRITRYNSRHMFSSLTHWTKLADEPGLVVELDLTRLSTVRRPPVPERRGFYYSKTNVLDTYEMLRQFFDSIDDLSATLITVIFPQPLTTDVQRGLPSYHALYLRVVNEVRDIRFVNPLATLVRIGGAA